MRATVICLWLIVALGAIATSQARKKENFNTCVKKTGAAQKACFGAIVRGYRNHCNRQRGRFRKIFCARRLSRFQRRIRRAQSKLRRGLRRLCTRRRIRGRNVSICRWIPKTSIASLTGCLKFKGAARNACARKLRSNLKKKCSAIKHRLRRIRCFRSYYGLNRTSRLLLGNSKPRRKRRRGMRRVCSWRRFRRRMRRVCRLVPKTKASGFSACLRLKKRARKACFNKFKANLRKRCFAIRNRWKRRRCLRNYNKLRRTTRRLIGRTKLKRRTGIRCGYTVQAAQKLTVCKTYACGPVKFRGRMRYRCRWGKPKILANMRRVCKRRRIRGRLSSVCRWMHSKGKKNGFANCLKLKGKGRKTCFNKLRKGLAKRCRAVKSRFKRIRCFRNLNGFRRVARRILSAKSKPKSASLKSASLGGKRHRKRRVCITSTRRGKKMPYCRMRRYRCHYYKKNVSHWSKRCGYA